MNITTLKRAFPYLNKAGVTPLIWGWHGRGKSQSVKQYCQVNGYYFEDVRLGQCADAGDLIGLAEFIRDSSGLAQSTKFVIPNKFQKVIKYCQDNPNSAGVIFLDEINRAGRKDIMQAVFQLILDKQIDENVLPSNCFIITAANPNTSDYVTLNMDDKALWDRFCHIKLDPSRDEWFKYAKDAEYSEDILDFLIEQKEMLEETDLEDFNLSDIAKRSRRSWEMINNLIRVGTPMDLLQELCYGIIGTTATVAFMDSIKNKKDKPIKPEQILNKYNKVKDRVLKYSDHKTGGRQDILKYSCDDFVRYIEKRTQAKKSLTKAEAANMMEFLKDIPLEMAYDLGRQLYFEEICRTAMDKDLDYQNKVRKARGMKLVEGNKA